MATKKAQSATLTITAPNIQVAHFRVIGTAPYVQHKFSDKARKQIMQTQAAGSTAKSKRKREAKDFNQVYEDAKHIGANGKLGIPATSFRNAMIEACRGAGFVMTKARMSVFVEHDFLDATEGTGLVEIHGKPRKHEGYARNETGVVDIRVRPMWEQWHADVRVEYDADQFTATDVGNLLLRAGKQIGIGEGRPYSKKSNGMGWGTFTVETVGEAGNA